MTLRDHAQEAALQNPLVPLGVGLVSLLTQLDRLLTDEGTGAAAARRPALDRDDPFVLAALGLVSLRRTLDGWLASACPEPPSRPAQQKTSAAPRRPANLAR